MASLGGEHEIAANDIAGDTANRTGSREGSVERKERDDKLRVARERQNEERQKKIEELKAQAEAAQRYREQKEEERRRRIEEIRQRDTEKRSQVEERKKAIMEAEKERREYILRKNQERESRIENKKRDKSSFGYAFGSSTPRLLEPADFGIVSSSTFWGQRRSTSTCNVAGSSLSRRSSERELTDSGAKKRATSASGTDRHEDDIVDTSQIVFRSVARRKTDLMPTIPSPRDGHYGSRSSLSNTPSRTPGRAYSMNRLDQLAQPIRRNGEHIRAIMERERREQMELMDETESLGGGRRSAGRRVGAGSGSGSKMSRSMIHLAGGEGAARPKYNIGTRSGTVTPGGHLNTSRPGSAMSTSTSMSTTGFINRRSLSSARKPRPASIAGTGVSLEEINKLKKENKPPVKNSTVSPSTLAQTTPKRTPASSSMMSKSLIVTSSSRLFSAEKKTPPRREPLTPKAASTHKPLSKATSSDRLHKLSLSKEKSRDAMTKSAITPPVTKAAANSNHKAEAAVKSKELKEALNQNKTEEDFKAAANAAIDAQVVMEKEAEPQQQVLQTQQQNGGNSELAEATPMVDNSRQPESLISLGSSSPQEEEKSDEGTEKETTDSESMSAPKPPKSRNGSKEGSMVRDLPQGDSSDMMTASMIAKSKITTEEEAKAALAERRRLAREEAERQAELERQRLEAERLAEIKRQEEEAERQRQFEEESTRLAQEQRKAEEERLRQAIEEAKLREEEEKRKREEEEKQRLEREEAEKKAKEEAEKQRVEHAERLKREEKEREERRKRVEAIMSRTRRAGAGNTPNSTPTKENNNSVKSSADENSSPALAAAANAAADDTQTLNNVANTSSSEPAAPVAAQPVTENNTAAVVVNNESGSPSSPSGSSTTTSISPSTPAGAQPQQQQHAQSATPEPQNSQAMYEQSVLDRENALINSFSNMIIDQNAKNKIVVEETNGKLFADLKNNGTQSPSVANGNGHHIESINNKNEMDLMQTVLPNTNQLIDLSLDAQDNVNYNNNNSLLTATTTTTLVTADSHENKDISLL